MGVEVQVSFPLAFAAGVVSFLSPCILPVVPSYLAFVSGLTLEELRDAPSREVRAGAVLHSTLFMVGFAAVFMTMGLVATAAGAAVAAALPWINRVGGVVMMVFGSLLLGLVRIPGLSRDLRPRLASRPAGALGSLAVGVAFGAGWTPCIGPVLGAILLYASLEATVVHGTLLLVAYALGLGVPFVAASSALGWFMAGSERVRRWLAPLRGVAGTVLLVIGFMMVTGRFATLTAFLAGLGQLINLEIS
ncbi:MAG TPA: cytochrome c biogenesis protein CcdA [Longimicrobiales bacterium]|nr:cytochrome c biogenesis protein CcdA [Longimicrobiales bacterium]